MHYLKIVNVYGYKKWNQRQGDVTLQSQAVLSGNLMAQTIK